VEQGIDICQEKNLDTKCRSPGTGLELLENLNKNGVLDICPMLIEREDIVKKTDKLALRTTINNETGQARDNIMRSLPVYKAKTKRTKASWHQKAVASNKKDRKLMWNWQ